MSSYADYSAISRRQLARMAGAAGISVGLAPAMIQRGMAATTQTAADIIPGKSAEMIIHNAMLLVTETPLNLLRKYRHTPKDILFSRYHFPHAGNPNFDTLGPSPAAGNWTISIDGLVERPRQVTFDELARMPQEKRVAVLQCAGNGRAFFAKTQKVPGGQWHNGGMGNLVWEGVPLRPLLAELNPIASPHATWLTAQPWIQDQPSTPGGTGFSKSFHLDDPALDNAILAIKMNGEPIPALHGGPVRLIVPGYYGNMNVKVLGSLLFMSRQSPSVYQSVGYRMPLHPVKPGQFKFDEYNTRNSVPTYAHVIKSVIFSPLPEDKPRSGKVKITGVAFNDGKAPITMVEVSTDGGKSWHDASIETPESPWAWHHWSLATRLPAGKHVLMARATDALGRSQPMNGQINWNPRGYEWHGVEPVEVAFG